MNVGEWVFKRALLHPERPFLKQADWSCSNAAFSRRVARAVAALQRLGVEPGDRVTSGPDGRDLLSCRRDSRSCVWVRRVHTDFQNQCTNLTVVRQRI